MAHTSFFIIYFIKWLPLAIFIFCSFISKIDRVLPLYVINDCTYYEFDTCKEHTELLIWTHLQIFDVTINLDVFQTIYLGYSCPHFGDKELTTCAHEFVIKQ